MEGEIFSIGVGAALGAATGATFGPVGAASGAIVGAAGRTIMLCTEKLRGEKEGEEKNFLSSLKDVAVIATNFFGSVGVTMAVAGVPFKAACLFCAIASGYGIAVLLIIGIISLIAGKYFHDKVQNQKDY